MVRPRKKKETSRSQRGPSGAGVHTRGVRCDNVRGKGQKIKTAVNTERATITGRVQTLLIPNVPVPRRAGVLGQTKKERAKCKEKKKKRTNPSPRDSFHEERKKNKGKERVAFRETLP